VPLLIIESIVVGSDRLEAVVRVPSDEPVRTSAAPGSGTRAVKLLPGLVKHTCENGSAHGIAAELADTESPHLLEHVTFELMALSGSPRTLRGETVWDFSADGRGVFRVRLGFDDDLVALAALREGVGVCEWLLEPGLADKPDIGAIVVRLVELRGRDSGTSR